MATGLPVTTGAYDTTYDINGDGFADIIWRNKTTGELKGWLIDADGFSARWATTFFATHQHVVVNHDLADIFESYSGHFDRQAGAQGGDAVATVKAGWREGAPIIVNSSRAILYASSADDYAQAARRAAEATRDTLEAAKSD